MRFIWIALVFGFFSSCAQKDSTVYIKEIGWIIKLPSDLRIDDSAKVSTEEARGQKIVEDVNNQKIDLSNTKILITAKKDELNWFTVSYNSSQGITHDNWKQADIVYYNLVLNALIKKSPVKVDTGSSVVIYDGIEFIKYQAIMALNDKLTINMFHLCSFCKGHCMIIGYIYTENVVGDEIVRMLKTSKFAISEPL